jgi:hypothetical protein
MTAREPLAALALATVLAAYLGGAGVWGRAPRADAAGPTGTVERARLHGAFWRPADSNATRPPPSLRQVSWAPPEARPRRPHGDAVASVQAVLRLAASD